MARGPNKRNPGGKHAGLRPPGALNQILGESATLPPEAMPQSYRANVPFPKKFLKNKPRGTTERVELREMLVSEYVLAGLNNVEIAEKLAEQADSDPDFEFLRVSHQTVANDRRLLIQRMQYQQLENMNGLRSLWTARAEAAIAAIWPKILEGNMWAIDRLLAIGTFESRLWGLDQASGAAMGDVQAQAAIERLVVTIRTMGLEPSDVIGQLIEGIRGERAQLPQPETVEAEYVEEKVEA